MTVERPHPHAHGLAWNELASEREVLDVAPRPCHPGIALRGVDCHWAIDRASIHTGRHRALLDSGSRCAVSDALAFLDGGGLRSPTTMSTHPPRSIWPPAIVPRRWPRPNAHRGSRLLVCTLESCSTRFSTESGAAAESTSHRCLMTTCLRRRTPGLPQHLSGSTRSASEPTIRGPVSSVTLWP